MRRAGVQLYPSFIHFSGFFAVVYIKQQFSALLYSSCYCLNTAIKRKRCSLKVQVVRINCNNCQQIVCPLFVFFCWWWMHKVSKSNTFILEKIAQYKRPFFHTPISRNLVCESTCRTFLLFFLLFCFQHNKVRWIYDGIMSDCKVHYALKCAPICNNTSVLSKVRRKVFTFGNIITYVRFCRVYWGGTRS